MASSLCATGDLYSSQASSQGIPVSGLLAHPAYPTPFLFRLLKSSRNCYTRPPLLQRTFFFCQNHSFDLVLGNFPLFGMAQR